VNWLLLSVVDQGGDTLTGRLLRIPASRADGDTYGIEILVTIIWWVII